MPIISGVGSSPSTGPTSGGKFYAINNLTVTPQVVARANSARRSIIFHNPGTIDIYIAPVQVISNGAGVNLTPSLNSLGGTIIVYGNGGTILIDGECQLEWQAFAASGSGNPLTVIDSNA